MVVERAFALGLICCCVFVKRYDKLLRAAATGKEGGYPETVLAGACASHRDSWYAYD